MRASAIAIGIAAALTIAPSAASAAPPPVGHVFVIVLENKGFGDSYGVGQVAAPYMTQTLPSQGLLIPRYYGIGHSSADNYLAMIGGQPPTPASKDDCPDPLKHVDTAAVQPYNLAKSDGCLYPPNFPTIGDQLTVRGLRWKGYMEDIPAPCSPLKDSPVKGTHYARKHNPFVFFQSLILSGQCAAGDVALGDLADDLTRIGSTPNLVYVTPNECSDGHTNCTTQNPDTPLPGEVFTPSDTYYELQQEDAFLKTWVPRILASPAYRRDGLLVITYDESDSDLTACCNEQPGPADPNPGGISGSPGPGGGQTGAVLLSPFIEPGSTTSQEYNHYSLLRSLEDLFGMSHLGYAGQQGLVAFGDDVYNGPRPAPPPGGGGGGGGGGTKPPPHGGPPPCRNTGRPRSELVRRAHSRRRVAISGRSSERGCDGRAVAVRVAQVAIGRVATRGRCRFLTSQGRRRPRTRCKNAFWLLARGGGSGWHLRVRGPIPRGRYLLRYRAIDADGRREHVRGVRFTIR